MNFDYQSRLVYHVRGGSLLYGTWNENSDEDLEQMFGDHAKVFVTRNGSFRVDYDHD